VSANPIPPAKVFWVVIAIAITTFLSFRTKAYAQESTSVPSATTPGEGRFYFRQLFTYSKYSDDPSPDDRTIEKMTARSRLSYGVTGNLALNLEVPIIYASERHAGSHHPNYSTEEVGVGDINLDLKFRPFQWDLGPVDTLRLAFITGIQIPTYDKDLSSRGFDPYVGVVFSGVLGRHGINQSLRYKFNTNGLDYPITPGDGTADALFYDTSYLFRLLPAEYAADTQGSLYLTVELNGIYETNGDNEILLGPGILYEAKGFAIEAAAGLPIVRDVDERPRTDLVFTIGFRLLF